MQGRYRLLSKIASRIVAITRKTGVPIGPETQALYRVALQNYMHYGGHVIDALKKKGLTVEQIVVRNGVPVVDPAKPDRFKTLVIATPLIPSPVLPGALQPISGIGAVPIAIVAIGGLVVRVVSSAAFKKLAAWIVGGYITLKALEQINITIHGHPLEPKPVELLAKQIDLYDKLVAAGAKPDLAWKQAAASGEPPAKREPWTRLALGALAIGAGTFAAVKIFGGGKS